MIENIDDNMWNNVPIVCQVRARSCSFLLVCEDNNIERCMETEKRETEQKNKLNEENVAAKIYKFKFVST